MDFGFRGFGDGAGAATQSHRQGRWRSRTSSPRGCRDDCVRKHLLRTQGAQHVWIHPDGEHGKQFDFSRWLERREFRKVSTIGATAYGGVYEHSAGQTITVNPRSGLGDVVAEIGDYVISAECKGGVINTRHSGQVSRLYKGLCETVGMLMATPTQGRQVAVVPFTAGTLRLAERLAPRCALAGIEIALVGSHGEVVDVKSP